MGVLLLWQEKKGKPEMRKEQKKIQVAGIVHASWNPRTPEELAWDHPEMVALATSIRAVGVVQPIAVWHVKAATDSVPDGGYICIAGNRRLEAARSVGHTEIPALVFEDISEVQAREITRVENEVRLGINPLKDAELVGSMLKLGYNQKEIASHFGVSEAKICRRAKLLGLISEIRDLASSGEGCLTVDALEQIALYPASAQRACLSVVKREVKRGMPIHWQNLKYTFDAETRDLDKGHLFDTTCCQACPKRTGAQADLFDEIRDGDCLGRCLDCECFDRKKREHHVERLRERFGDVDMVDVEQTLGSAVMWRIKERKDTGDRRSAKRPTLYWRWQYWIDDFEIVWGPKLSDLQERMKREAEQAKADESARAKNAEADRVAQKRRAEERVALESAVESAFKAFPRLDDIDEKTIASTMFGAKLNIQQTAFVSRLIGEVLTYENFEDAEVVDIFTMFPRLAKKFKIKDSDFKAFKTAKAALDRFDGEVE